MNRTHLTKFNQWLDAVVEGRSTPSTTASDPTLQEATSAARQLHDLAQLADAAPPHRSLPPTWEEFMHAHSIEPSPQITRSNTFPHPTSGVSGRGLAAPLNDALKNRPARYASNAIVIAVVMAVLLAGGWRASQHYNSGPPEELATIPLGAFLQDEATPESAPSVDLLAPATADQCTIEPLTVDQVVAIVQDPWAYERGEPATPGAQLLPSTPQTQGDLYIATPDSDPNAERPAEFATDDALAGVTESFHMFEACIEANSYFQLWATLTPTLVHQSIIDVLPPLTGADDLRALLTDLESNGPGDPQDTETIFRPLQFSGFAGGSMSPLETPEEVSRVSRTVDQNLENTWMPEPQFVVTGYTQFWPGDPDQDMPAQSIYDSNLDGTPEPLIGFDPRLKQPGCFTIIFSWSDTREMWLIQQYPVCG